MTRKDLKTMKKKVVTAFMMAALGSSLVFSQAVMAADTTAKTETSEDADKDSTESEDKDVAEDADKADEEKEDLKTIGEKPEEDTEGVFSVKLKNLTVDFRYSLTSCLISGERSFWKKERVFMPSSVIR